MSGPLAAGAAPGKVILFGEHAVVYGRPAVAAALETGLGATAEFHEDGPWLHIPAWGDGLHRKLSAEPVDALSEAFLVALKFVGFSIESEVALTLDGELPLGVGLGSSAAFAVCMLRALARLAGLHLSAPALLEGAAQVEKVFHGTPSGLDHTVVALGGCLRFEPGKASPFDRISLPAPLPVVVAWTPRVSDTKRMVGGLRNRCQTHGQLYEAVFDHIANLTEHGVDALRAGDLQRLGTLMNLNHGLLNACGVSHPRNEEMVYLARVAGALGAKLTGGGGGGAIVALTPGRSDEVFVALRAAGFNAFKAKLG